MDKVSKHQIVCEATEIKLKLFMKTTNYLNQQYFTVGF